jgi:hypothetical protein
VCVCVCVCVCVLRDYDGLLCVWEVGDEGSECAVLYASYVMCDVLRTM